MHGGSSSHGGSSHQHSFSKEVGRTADQVDTADRVTYGGSSNLRRIEWPLRQEGIKIREGAPHHSFSKEVGCTDIQAK